VLTNLSNAFLEFLDLFPFGRTTLPCLASMQIVMLHIVIIIIINQLVTQLMSVKNKLTNRSCELATAVRDGRYANEMCF